MSRYLYLFIFKKKKEREPNDITSKQNFMNFHKFKRKNIIVYLKFFKQNVEEAA